MHRRKFLKTPVACGAARKTTNEAISTTPQSHFALQ
jgi:hypothetical protein